ncbi:glycoside hydrolase family 30 beta sandwich domain-containing protein [Microbacterium sp. NPDC089320]|uniref:glycoside hydrolase family 30 protein n=1 Tax=Microbacterium sp. NPDC089320 TaxID=3155182 RepID=UPI003435BA85
MTGSRVEWIVSTEDAPWRRETGAAFGSTQTPIPSVFVESDRPAQRIEGFGAAFSELGWLALGRLSDTDRAEVLRTLFAPGVGAGLVIGRTPIGASDFARSWYSYDEVDGDLALDAFSVENDLDTLVPFIRAASAVRPDLRVWASPWSPPAWMKTNGHYAATRPAPGSFQTENGLREDQRGSEGTDMIRLEEDVLDAYARYFGRYIDAYAEQGIAVGMVMPQNEFNSTQVFPSCTWTPEGLARFVRHLAPQMRSRGVEVFLGTLERGDSGLIDRMLEDEVVRDAVTGVGVQWAGRDAAPLLHRDHPGLRIYQTEQECGDGRNDWRFARHAWALLRHYLAHGAHAYCYWNIALEEPGVSTWGWPQNSLVSVNATSGTYRLTPDYYVLAHASHFVQVEAVVLPTYSLTGYDDAIAFRNPDGSTVVVMHNPLSREDSISVDLGGATMTATLPAGSFNTFLVRAE